MRYYFPLGEGDRWTYFEHGVEEQSAFSQRRVWSETYGFFVNGSDVVHEQIAVRVQDEAEVGGDDLEYDNYVWDNEGLRFVASYEDENGRVERESYSPAPLILPLQLSLHQTVTSSFAGTVSESGGSASNSGSIVGEVTATLEALEDVTVEAGTFSECLRIHERISAEEYGQEGGDALSRWVEEGTIWLALGVGIVKETWTDTDYDDEGAVLETESEVSELRWAVVGGVAFGGGPQYWNGVDFTGASAHFEGSTMFLDDVIISNTAYNGLAFSLNLNDTVSYLYEPEGYPSVPIDGADFSSAYVKMNANCLSIYDIDISGARYWTSWTLQADPVIAFILDGSGAMEDEL